MILAIPRGPRVLSVFKAVCCKTEQVLLYGKQWVTSSPVKLWRDAADCKSVPDFSHIIMKSNDIRGVAVPGICAADRRTYGERVVNVWQEGKR